MRQIYSSIDIGTDAIKVVTLEYLNDKYNVLASVIVPSAGVKKGLIVDAALVSNSIKKAIKNTEAKLGTKIDKILATVPSNNMNIRITTGKVTLDKVDRIVTGSDIFSCLQNSFKNDVPKGMEVVTVLPIEFKIDNIKKVRNPLGLEGKELAVKGAVISVPKKNIYSVVTMLESIGIEVMDISISSISNYYISKSNELDNRVIGMIDIGTDKTIIAVFNKGILVKEAILPIGGTNIDHDITFTYKTDSVVSKEIKETFAASNRKYADQGEEYVCINRNNEKVQINQYRLAELIETRIVDLLKNAKNELNNLTNLEIGYIIITGGITSMLGFNAIVEDLFTRNAEVMNIGILGIRNNNFGGAFGSIKYFIEKLELREKDYTMFTEEKLEQILSPRKKFESNNVLGKIFEKIFD